MTHFLDEQGNIPKLLLKEARELANFFALVIDWTKKNIPSTLTTTDIGCFQKVCHGMIKSAVSPDKKEIHWFCPNCENEGRISDWQGTKWEFVILYSL